MSETLIYDSIRTYRGNTSMSVSKIGFEECCLEGDRIVRKSNIRRSKAWRHVASKTGPGVHSLTNLWKEEWNMDEKLSSKIVSILRASESWAY